MDRLLSILEEKKQPLQECIDAEKLRFIASKLAIWDFLCVPQERSLTLDSCWIFFFACLFYCKKIVHFLAFSCLLRVFVVTIIFLFCLLLLVKMAIPSCLKFINTKLITINIWLETNYGQTNE